jgi:FlaA1/EpsC-like NDP-sugar epimerase
MKFKIDYSKVERNILLYIIDAIIVACSYTVVWTLGDIQGHINWEILPYAINICATALIFALCFLVFRINKTIWRYASGREYILLFAISILAGFVSAVVFEIYQKGMPATIFLAFAGVLAATMITISRIVYKELVALEGRRKGGVEGGKRLLIVGAGEAGYRMLDEIKRNPNSGLLPIGFIDDDIQKQNRTIDQIKVLGQICDIEKVCDERSIQAIYIAIPSASTEDRKRILDECAKTKCSVKILPYLYELNEEGGDIVSRVRDITPEELLGREPIKVANEKILSFV